MSRTVNILGDLVSRIADAGRLLMPANQNPDLGKKCDHLLSGKGEATGLALARVILDQYAGLSPDARRAFFTEVRDRFGVDAQAVEAAIARWRSDGAPALHDLHDASEPRSLELFRRLNRAPGGTQALVSMRRDLLDLADKDPSFRALANDFRHLFTSWFNRGFLELRRIDWETPASVLEKIIRYEAVHEISGWDDLRRRVAARDRRLYAFFHPALRDDPLIFVEVALTSAIPAAIGPILAENRPEMDPQKATVAVFYSISNCQEGLRGISFGNFLIKQVAEELSREFRGLATFVTLSPVPGLRRWALAEMAAGRLPARFVPVVARLELGEVDAALGDLCAYYMLETRAPGGGATDPVARFHLGNGARLERINLSADGSPRGIAISWGAMVNYLYDLDMIERNHEAYSNGDEIIASAAVRRRLRVRRAGPSLGAKVPALPAGD